MKNRWTLQVLSLVIVLSSPAWAQVTRLVSVSSGGTAGNGDSFQCSISADGLSVAFYSNASTLVSGDTNGRGDIFDCAWPSHAMELVSVDSSELLSNGPVEFPAVSADGRFVAFASSATNLVAGDTNGFFDVFVRSRSAGTTQRVSISSAGVQGNGNSYYSSISADGRYVAFASDATNLVPGDTNGCMDIFVRDLLNAVTERVSMSFTAIEANGNSIEPSISADGSYVAFTSFATNIGVGDTNGCTDVFIRDRQSQFSYWLSIPATGPQSNGNSGGPSISADGGCVAFLSGASNMVAGDTNGAYDVFYRAWHTSPTQIVSVSSNGTVADAASSSCSISADGRYVAFASDATNLVPGDTNGAMDVFVRSISAGATERVSVSSNGAQGNNSSEAPSISADGRFVAFTSNASNLVPGDTNGSYDVFIHDRNATGFTSLCEPGVGGVRTCPCSNPPGSSGRGCDNSSATGGALLTASGIAYLSTDTLVFTTFAERPSALSILLQGNALAGSGLAYGQGVRCVGGTLKRLFTRNASSGSVSVPDFPAGDPSVSGRSAAKGDTIHPGQSRWYLVYYRDPIVLGGCAASSTFNATQTGEVTWMP